MAWQKIYSSDRQEQSKWHGLHTDPKADPSKVSTWGLEASKLNSSYSRIARYTRLSSTSTSGKPLEGNSTRNGRVALPLTPHDLPRTSQAQTRDILNVNFPVVQVAITAPRHSQKKDLSPGPADCHYKECKLKSVKSVSCVTQLSCVNPVSNVRKAVLNMPVGARLQNFWQTWLDLGAGPKVVQILREGYTLPFRNRPKLTRFPTVISCYANPHRNSYLLEALHQLIDKNAVELVQNQISLGVFQPTIFSPKAQQQTETYLRSEQTESFPQGEEIQNGDTGNHQDVPPTKGVGHLNRFQRRLLVLGFLQIEDHLLETS